MGREIGYDSGTYKIFENREGLDTGRPRSPFGYYTKWCQLMGTGTIHAITSFPGRVGEGIFCFYGLPFGNRTSRKPKRHRLNGKRCCNAVRTGGPVTSLQQRLNGQPREQGCPLSIFEAGQCNPLLRFVLTRAEKMEGVSKGGNVPLWHTTFGTEWKKSSVLYLLPRLAREREWAAGQPLSRTRKADGEMERQQPFLRLLSEGAKGIYSPRLSSPVPPQRHQCGSLRRRSSSAARSVFFARFSVR